MLVPPMYC